MSIRVAAIGCYGLVAGVCTQTPEYPVLDVEFRGLITDPGHEPVFAEAIACYSASGNTNAHTISPDRNDARFAPKTAAMSRDVCFNGANAA